MPSSLAMVLSSALGFSPHPPVSVCGTDGYCEIAKLFSEAWRQHLRPKEASPSRLRRMRCGFTYTSPYSLGPGRLAPGAHSLLHPSSITCNSRYRNIDLLSIDYAFRPRLRIRLTLGGFAFPRKPWVFGDADSHCISRYSCPHTH